MPPSARQQSRAVLRQILSTWSNLPADQLPLRESPRGPLWFGLLHGETLNISLSYTDTEIWVALVRGARIGVDAMTLQAFPEIASVAQAYFHPDTAAVIQQSKNPLPTFASAWTDIESRLKCLKLDLVEWSPARDTALASSRSISLVRFQNTLLSIAIAA